MRKIKESAYGWTTFTYALNSCEKLIFSFSAIVFNHAGIDSFILKNCLNYVKIAICRKQSNDFSWKNNIYVF